jgi:hypothetical protein
LAKGGVVDKFLCFITVSGMCSLKLNLTFEKVSVLRFSLKMLDLSLSYVVSLSFINGCPGLIRLS